MYLSINSKKILLRNFLKLLIKNGIIIYIIFLRKYIYNLKIKYLNNYNNFNHIHIAMSLDNNYIYPILVSVTSIIINAKNTTFIHFHLIIDDEFKEKNKYKISLLKNINKNICFEYHNVKKNFLGWKIDRGDLPIISYYRILIPELIKEIDKIIYLDGDTITYDDLKEMYNLNMTNLLFKGLREYKDKDSIPFVNVTKYICAGVMLMNLKLLRENNSFEKFKKYYNYLYEKKTSYNDQNIINTVFIDKIGFLPPKFGIFLINEDHIKDYEKIKPIVYNRSELIEANKKPVIRHIWGNITGKPWIINEYNNIKDEWNYYANKTGFYKEICKYYKNACINLNKY